MKKILNFRRIVFGPCRRGRMGRLCAAVLILGISFPAWSLAQDANPAPSLQQHFDAAERLQSGGDLGHAAIEYKLFLAAALDRLAKQQAAAGDYQRAAPEFEEALVFSPYDSDVRLDYADAARAAGDLAKAHALALRVVDAEPKNAKARLALGRVLLRSNEALAASKQLEAATALEPDLVNGYTLATAYLALKDEKAAATIFSELLAPFGDTAEIHMDFGRAYGEAGFPELAIVEFKKTIARNDKFPGAHYSLGASYLLSMGEIDFPQALAEFNKELQISPDDFLTHSQLGYVALTQHRYAEADTELTRAAQLDPWDPDTFVSLGQLYTQLNKPAEAETALRKAIALTTDPARNHYQVQRAHYLLGRLLIQSARKDEAKEEMAVAQRLLTLSVQQNQGKPGSMERERDRPSSEKPITRPVDPEAQKQVAALEKRIGPAIADSYNNLGAISASGEDFSTALTYFAQARIWNPALEGLDYNWGRAAFSGREFGQAIGPLSRYLQSSPEDAQARSMLGYSQFMLKDYRAALHSLEVVKGQVEQDPTLGYALAESLIRTGDFNHGLEKLKGLEQADPNSALLHFSVGEALAGLKDYSKAAEELRTAIRLNPANEDAKHSLELVKSELERKEAMQNKSPQGNSSKPN